MGRSECRRMLKRRTKRKRKWKPTTRYKCVRQDQTPKRGKAQTRGPLQKIEKLDPGEKLNTHLTKLHLTPAEALIVENTGEEGLRRGFNQKAFVLVLLWYINLPEKIGGKKGEWKDIARETTQVTRKGRRLP